MASNKSNMEQKEFFNDYGEANRYTVKEVIGKGSYGVVCSATDNYTGEKVAIKKINNVFEHVSDATRILREIKLLRLLKHPGKPLTGNPGPDSPCTRCLTRTMHRRHCGDQAHHASANGKGVQGYLRRL
jgi:serine/threonine protein kinase